MFFQFLKLGNKVDVFEYWRSESLGSGQHFGNLWQKLQSENMWELGQGPVVLVLLVRIAVDPVLMSSNYEDLPLRSQRDNSVMRFCIICSKSWDTEIVMCRSLN